MVCLFQNGTGRQYPVAKYHLNRAEQKQRSCNIFVAVRLRTRLQRYWRYAPFRKTQGFADDP
jgi:CO/xanthine dehydrogenase FAD-binding subunit